VELSLPRDSGAHALVIRHAGFGEKHRSVGTQADAELTLDLAPEAEAEAPPAAAGVPRAAEAPPTQAPASDLLAPKF
jgi:hypothetical protein